MNSSFLRRFRILLSGIVFISFFVVFADFRFLVPSAIMKGLGDTQFVPSLLSFLQTGAIAAAVFIVIIILTLITGRSYCSFICPLGIGMDMFSRIGGFIRKKFRRYGYKKPFTITRYTILALSVIITAIWGLYLISLLDPFSIFGRFMLFFAKPAVLIINNFASGILGKFDIFTLSHEPIRGFGPEAYIIPSVFFLLVGLMSLIRGRLYCNMICPVGTLLGLFSKISIFTIKFDRKTCKRCGRCAVRCKSSCIDFISYDVDSSRCVKCFNCLTACQDKALSYGLSFGSKDKKETDEGRRTIIITTLLALAGISGNVQAQDKKQPAPKKESTVRENRSYPVLPPGGASLNSFNAKCTACSLCITACPNKVLQPAVKEYGLTGFMQPVMNYHKGFCAFNCNKCTEICPTGALNPLALEAKKLTQLGKVSFIKDNCIVKTERTACGACSESCPTKAVYMVPYEGSLLIPETNTQICIGCGHCEYSCPTRPYKAIFVDGNPQHTAAEKPQVEKTDIKAPVEFPF